jgi:23S rRNA (adenine2503-C2)-methyltransferase
MEKITLCGLTAEEISGLIETEGFNLRHAAVISNSIYKKKASSLADIVSLPLKLRNYLDSVADTGLYEPVTSVVSADKSVKYLFRNQDGLQYETVYIPENKRITVCVSTQSGCRMGCPLCVTGKYGFHGNLSAGDIVNQALSMQQSEKVTHVVFMGMGEPLDNLDNVLKACEIFTAQWGLSLSPRNITVSTVGITPAIAEFLARSACNLTLSLYSPFPEERLKTVPVERIFPYRDIIDLMKNFPLHKKRRFSVAYVMIKDFNDTNRHLEGLKELLAGTRIRVNLLPFHTVKEDMHRSSTDERMLFFKHNLVVSGISASIRRSRGTDISAACGLLAGEFLC